MQNLFAYGTLMCADIMHEVAGCRPQRSAGVLVGYRRRLVRGEPYPGLTPDETGRVDGVLYRGLPNAAWARLDRFEGAMYARRAVRVNLVDGRSFAAAAYVVRPAFLHRLTEADWDFAVFLRSGKARFQRDYRGYRAL